MTSIRAIGVVFLLLAMSMVLAAQDPQMPGATFRSVTGAVRVDVSVQRAGRPVTNLTAADFELLDNGIVQEIAEASFGKLPIDVTLALDVSNSVSGSLLNDLRQSVEQLRGRLKEGDRLKLMTFNQRVQRLVDFNERVDTRAAFSQLAGVGSTSIFDAMAVALTSAASADRRHLMIFFSDGRDTSSVTTPDTLVDVAMRTTPTVAFVGPMAAQAIVQRPALRPPQVQAMSAAPADAVPPPMAPTVASTAVVNTPLTMLYDRLARETGGVVLSLPAVRGATLSSTFGNILDDFRSSYVVYFRPRGVERKGFHTINVTVKQQGFSVRARRGYVED